jgi:hypothetical protein
MPENLAASRVIQIMKIQEQNKSEISVLANSL